MVSFVATNRYGSTEQRQSERTGRAEGACHGAQEAGTRADQRTVEGNAKCATLHACSACQDWLGRTLREPQCDFLLRGLDSVRAVDDVAAHLDTVVTADCARLGGCGVGGTCAPHWHQQQITLAPVRVLEALTWPRTRHSHRGAGGTLP